MSAQPQSVLRTPRSLRGIVAHLLVETQDCWALTDKQHYETDGEKTIIWRALPDAEGEKFVCGRRGAPPLKGCSVAYGHIRMPPNAGPSLVLWIEMMAWSPLWASWHWMTCS
jgi:hypothetical protein